MTILRGPSDKAAFRNDPEKWTGYIDPLPADDIATPDGAEHPSVSDIKKAWPKNLTDWAAREAAKTAWKFRTALTGMSEQEAVDLIAPASNRQRDAAAKRGHTIHDMLEHQLFHPDKTLLLEADDPAGEYLDCIADLVAELQPEVVASEVIVFGTWTDTAGTVHRWAGTFDAVWRIDGELVLVDYKSRKLGKAATRYPEEGVQLGAYSSAAYWIVEDDTGLHRVAPLELARGLILSIAPDGWRSYKVDLEQAREHWLTTVSFKATQKAAPKMFARPTGRNVESGGDVAHVDPAPVTSAEGTGSAPAGEPSVDAPRHVGDILPEVLHQARVAWVLRRVDVLKAHSDEALKMVATGLPEGAPTPKAVREGATWTPEQVDAYDAHVAKVEATFEIPFGGMDPRIERELQDELVAAEARRDARATPIERPEPTPAPPVEGGPYADDQDVDSLRDVIKFLMSKPESAPMAEHVLAWARDGQEYGQPWNMAGPGQHTSARRYAICAAALELIDLVVFDLTDFDVDTASTPHDPDAVVRLALAMVIGDDALKPALPVGGLLGTLTADQAVRLGEIATTHRSELASDGSPQLVAAA